MIKDYGFSVTCADLSAFAKGAGDAIAELDLEERLELRSARASLLCDLLWAIAAASLMASAASAAAVEVLFGLLSGTRPQFLFRGVEVG